MMGVGRRGVTGLGRTSLYAAFGDKEAMFGLALEQYWQGRMTRTRAVLCTGRKPPAGVAALLAKVVVNLSDTAQPAGCRRVNAALESGCVPAPALDAVRAMQAELEAAIGARLDDAGRHPRHAVQARFVATTIHGRAVRAKLGTSRTELSGIRRLALAALA